MLEEADAQRRVPEPPSDRGPYQRDRARVLHSGALRRLAGKTQVVEPGGLATAIPRTRLTHSLECAQIGRELGGALGCDADLVDAACLAHDLGHPPYGHNGETALDQAAAACGGFEGNAQSLRILTRLEPKVVGAGLNLTRATLDAATKYPWPRQPGRVKYGAYACDAAAFAWLRAGAPPQRRCLEAQVMDWADDVAYSVHDLEDGVASGQIPLAGLAAAAEEVAEVAARHYSELPAGDIAAAFEDLMAQPWWPRGYDGTAGSQAELKAATSRLIGRLCSAAQAATRAAYGDEPLRRYAADLVVPAPARAECAALKAVTAHYVMNRPGVQALQEREREVVAELVARLADRAPEGLEPLYAQWWREAGDDAERLRVVVDQVASLTDLAAAALHARMAPAPRRASP